MTHLVCGGGIVKLMKLKKMEMKDRSRRRTRVSRLPGNTFQPRSTTLAIIAVIAIIAIIAAVIVVSISIITDTIISVKFEDSVFESFLQGGGGRGEPPDSSLPHLWWTIFLIGQPKSPAEVSKLHFDCNYIFHKST